MPEQRFTFSFSLKTPRRHVRCESCGWQASGDNGSSVLDLADAHTCADAEIVAGSPS